MSKEENPIDEFIGNYKQCLHLIPEKALKALKEKVEQYALNQNDDE